MEGITTSYYHGEKVYQINFIHCGESKEDTLNMINAIGDEFERNPLNSVLALVDVTYSFFHFDTLKTFSKLNERCYPYKKKIAIIGLKGLKKAGFNSMINKKDSIKAFDSEPEAMEWLVSD